MQLPQPNKLERAKMLENEYINPENLDIFTEEEASYQASILRVRQSKDNTYYDEDILNEIYKKTRQTIKLVSYNVLQNKIYFEECEHEY